MTGAVLAGAVVGIGVWLALTALRPTPELLGAALARFDREPHAVVVPAVEDRDTRYGRFLLRRIPALARAVDKVRADLRVVGRTPEEQAVRVGSYVVLFLCLGPWVAAVTWLFKVPLPPIVPLLVAIFGSLWGVAVPFVSLRKMAAQRRQAFAHALSAWCDVVVMSLASGRGVEQAMETAAAAGTGWPFAELRAALRSGYVRGEPPWEALSRLGAELKMTDLSELANTIAMAGEEGAAVRITVTAKARTIRERIITETEMAAAAATERMSLPSVLLVLGFLIFLGYPAVSLMFQIGK